MIDDWRPVLDVHTPHAVLPAVVERLAADGVDRLRENLMADASLSADDRAAVILTATPLIRAELQKTVTGAWERAQLDGATVQ